MSARRDRHSICRRIWPAYLNAGDLLIGMDGDFRLARWHGEPGLRISGCAVSPSHRISPAVGLRTAGLSQKPLTMTSSVTVKHLSSKSIAAIPVPPMEQQESIVAEIEKQFSRLDEAVANLKRQGQLNVTRPPSSKPPSKASSPKNGARPIQPSNLPASSSAASSPNAAPSGKKQSWRDGSQRQRAEDRQVEGEVQRACGARHHRPS